MEPSYSVQSFAELLENASLSIMLKSCKSMFLQNSFSGGVNVTVEPHIKPFVYANRPERIHLSDTIMVGHRIRTIYLNSFIEQC